jgi:spoIIIJ-associated protein
MKYSEKWGTDVDEAVRLALEDLGATEDQIKVTVIEEPSKGFLGLGAKLAKVKVELLEDEPPVNKSKDSNKNNRPSSGEVGQKRDLRKKNKPGQTQSRSQGNRSGGGNRPSGGGRPQGGRPGRNDRNDRGHNREKNYEKIPPIDLSNKESLSEKPANLVPSEDSDAAIFIKDMIEKMGIDVEVVCSKNDECYYIEITGKDSRTIIGKRGQTLDSIQYLTNLVVNKSQDKYARTVIDVEGYRSRREKTLEQLGAKLAHKVLRTGRSVKLEPMNPYERKVIHSTLQGIDGITTRSEGEEPYRRVVVEKRR